MQTATDTIDQYLTLTKRELTARLQQGHAINPSALDNYEYKGISLGLPGFIDRLAWKTFKKVFHRDPETGYLRGWNLRIKQDGVHGRYDYQEKNGAPFAWGHYRVTELAGRKNPKDIRRGLLIDYSLGGNAWFDLFTNALRDPIVALHEDSADVLLGWSYAQFGPIRISTPSFFLLIRDCPLSHQAQPPAQPKQ